MLGEERERYETSFPRLAMALVLLVEDNASQRQALEEFLAKDKLFSHPLELYSAPDLEIARAVLKEKQVDLILSDLKLPDGTGIALVEEVRTYNAQIPFLILTGEPSIESAVEAIRKGANDYLLKPVDLTLLKKKIGSLLETLQLRVENQNLKKRIQENFSSKAIVGNSKALRNVIEKVKQVAPVDVTVLLEGESGTGKEMLANLIHESSARAKEIFVKVNCGALTKSLLESELFGAVRGAYTGAERDRQGYFESAHGGSIFLDEIGEMDMESQVRLLRVLEERKVTRVGSTKAIPVDVRIIAATNKNLLEEIERGNFREDLYYRLGVVKFKLPTLAERIEDLALLFNHFTLQFNDKYNRSVVKMSPELFSFCQAYPWPGNVREFANVLEGMVLLAQEDVLTLKDLPPDLQNFPNNKGKIPKLIKGMSPGFPIREYEKMVIAVNLKFFHGNREKTAKSLGIAERTLYRKIKEYNLEP